MSSPFPCSPVIRECSRNKTLIEKKTLQCSRCNNIKNRDRTVPQTDCAEKQVAAYLYILFALSLRKVSAKVNSYFKSFIHSFSKIIFIKTWKQV